MRFSSGLLQVHVFSKALRKAGCTSRFFGEAMSGGILLPSEERGTKDRREFCMGVFMSTCVLMHI